MSTDTNVKATNVENDSKSSPKINAFQFMMSSRHKVIGSNSLGKEKKEEEIRSPEMMEKAKEKLNKRKEVFENWAEKKGGMKRKIADEAAEYHINKTLTKRAKRLKQMLAIIDEELKNSGEETSDNENEIIQVKRKTSKSKVSVLIESENSSNTDDFNEIEICNISENDDNSTVRNSQEKVMLKENGNKFTNDNLNTDEKQEIKQLNGKLSEKENINSEVNTNKEYNIEGDKSKKKIRKKSLSLKKSKSSVDLSSTENKINNIPENNTNDDFSDDEIFPNNRKINTSIKNGFTKLYDVTLNTKKNECFSPRTWRMKLRLPENTETNSVVNLNTEETENLNVEQSEIIIEDSPEKQRSTEEGTNSFNANSETRKQVKLAPIFVQRQQKKINKASLDAKNNFLRSGVPSKVKKLMTKTKSSQETCEHKIKIFPMISHIQQRDELNLLWNLPLVTLPLIKIKSNTNSNVLFNSIKIGSFTTCSTIDIKLKSDKLYAPPSKYKNLKQIIKNIKQENQTYPVYKTFRLLYQKYSANKKNEIQIQVPKKIETSKAKRGRPRKKKEKSPEKTKIVASEISLQTNETQMWTEKYKPLSQEDIVGNITPVQELKTWLESWILYSEDQKSSRKRKLSNSSDDFCSDITSKDNDILPHNLILLHGPLGSGKTSSLYGLCNELNINIIEINASSKRPGKKILSDLQEATQSHQVKNTDSKSATNFFQKKSYSQSEDDINKKLSLLLFEDVDIVFDDQDENFISALTTLITSSKRPIVLTFTDKRCLHLQKFILQYRVINFNSVSKTILNPWFQILCSIEGVRVDKNMIDTLIDFNRGDFRKTILQLQFWVQTGGDYINKLENFSGVNTEVNLENEEITIDDDSSNLSWFDKEDNIEAIKIDSEICHNYCIDIFIPYYDRDKEGFKLSYPSNLQVLWWNIPNMLGQHLNNNILYKQTIQNEMKEKEVTETEKTTCLEDLSNAAIFLENLANADFIYTRLKTECYEEPIYNYWQINPVNSLSFNQNYDMYQETEHTSLEITHWILENSAQKCRKNSSYFGNSSVPYFEEINWRSKRHKYMKELINAVPTFSILDRRAICEDYQTILRNICRTENQRSITNNKRKNRFYHYFKNFNIHINDSACLLLCNTLATNNVE